MLATLVVVSALLVSPASAQTAPTNPTELREQVRVMPVPARDPVSLARRYGFAEAPAPTRQSAVGDRDVFQVLDQGLGSYREIEAELMVLSPHAEWWIQPGSNVDLSSVQVAAGVFESRTVDVIESMFGPVPSAALDSRGRAHVLVARIPGTGAYFSSVDVYPRWTHPYANDRPLLVMNVDAFRPGRPNFDETLSHELQHLVHWALNPADETWLDEGAAELAASIMRGSPGRGSSFTRQPDLQLTAWSADGTLGAHYEAAYLFVQYVTDRFGLEAILGSISRERGQAGIEAFLRSRGLEKPFEHLFADWVVANLNGNQEQRPIEFRYQHARPNAAVLGRLGPREQIADTVRQFGTDYVEVPSAVPAVRFEAGPNARLAAVGGPGENLVWWANRGDSMDTTLTRVVDLSSASRATLRFRTWFDTEPNYDFGYVAASIDGGQTWTPLSGLHTSSQNPTGNGYGAGFTGRVAEGPVWLDEEMDLSPFAGQMVWLRFEYVTDQAYNSHGWVVDDIAIPEIGYQDLDDSEEGWESDGFLRLPMELPSQFVVQVITFKDAEMTVHRQQVEGGQAFTLPLSSADQDRVILAISGTAPKTLMPSSYSLTALPSP